MASDPASAPARDPHPGNGRRALLRALTGGGALAALSVSGTRGGISPLSNQPERSRVFFTAINSGQ